MFRHTFRGFLFAPESATGGGGGDPAPKVDMGIPHSFDDEKPPVLEKTAPVKSDVEKRIEALESQSKADKARIEELSSSERYWADKARGVTPVVEPDDEEEVVTLPVNPFEGEKPEALLDDITVDGLKALRKRGVITEDQLLDEVGKIEKRINARVDQKLALNQRHNAVDAELAKFPELKDQKSPLFIKTQEHFRQMVADDPGIQNSPAALLSSVRFAKKELDMEAKAATPNPGDRQDTRRLRIAAQAGERSPAGSDDEGGGDDELSPTAREVVGNLSKFLEVRDGKGKVAISAEDNYRRHLKRG